VPDFRSHPIVRRLPLALGLTAWAGLVLGGLIVLLNYQSRAGAAAEAPAAWPVRSTLARDPHAATIVLFAHPHCPCTRATLDELARSLGGASTPVNTWIVFVVPPGEDASWAQTNLLKLASAVPHAHVTFDLDAVEARRFGAHTSGQVLYYDPAGRLCFAGGITPGRGHEGDNAGGDAIAALAGSPRPGPSTAASPATATSTTPVFGCNLASPSTGKESTCPTPLK